MWGLLHLVGGAFVTVIPFRFLPFVPEQDFTQLLRPHFIRTRAAANDLDYDPAAMAIR
jgi:hypothetical protein